MNGRKEICECDHDIATHFKDPATGHRLTCTARCDCRVYREKGGKKTDPCLPAVNYPSRHTDRPPHESVSCNCAGCVEYRRRHWYGGC